VDSELSYRRPFEVGGADVAEGRVSPQWIVIVTIASSAVLWFLKSYVDPVVREAWDSSQMRSQIVRFLQDKAFRGARKTVEQRAISMPQYGNLRVSDVSELDRTRTADHGVEVHLERRSSLVIRRDEEEAIERFVGDGSDRR
jgi:hypothetical protein